MKNWPRKRKLALCLLILLISLVIICSMSNWPSPTLEIAHRRMEKQMLVGPMDIIARLDFEHSPWDHLVIGKSEHGYTLFDYIDSLSWDHADLNYYPKAEDATLFCPEYACNTTENDSFLPIFLFPEKAVSADAKMTLRITVDDVTKTYCLDGERKDSSFYQFSLPTREMEGQFFWLLQQALTGAYSEYVLTGTVEIYIEYFDVSGDLIDTYSKTVTK